MTRKKYTGAPFGTQTSRFDVSGVHPQSKMPGTYTQVSYCKKANSKENSLLAPGMYAIDTGDFSDAALTTKAQGPNWERAFDMEKFNGIPHMLYREKWGHKKELAEVMGPGRYSYRDFMEERDLKPSSYRGVCQTGESRFPRESNFHTPGPGSYGRGGVPSAAVEERQRQSTSTMGMMEAADRECYPRKEPGSGLAPCRYGFPSATEELLNKKVSARGPYDLFSGDRHRLPQNVIEKRHMGPGKYDLKTSLDTWKDEHHMKHGRFSKRTQYPAQPTERVYCSTLSQWPRDEADPGPTHYTTRRRTYSAPVSRQPQPFNSSAVRFDKRAQAFLTGNFNPVGIGQYDLHRWHNYQHKNGNKDVFVSGTPRLPPRVDTPRELLLTERLYPKGISATRRLFQAVLEAPC